MISINDPILFDPTCPRPQKQIRNEHNEIETCQPAIKRRKSIFFSQQNQADLEANNLKVSADGSVMEHADVLIPGMIAEPGSILTWNGSFWIPQVPMITEIIPIMEINNQIISANGPVNIHNDVEHTLPTQGQILTWNGTNYVQSTPLSMIF